MIYFEFVILALRLEPVSLLTGFSNQRVNGFLNAFRNLRTHLRELKCNLTKIGHVHFWYQLA
jgi:hypothetical protein